MASINLTYKGLIGAYGTITGFDDTTTIDDLITAIAADEGLDTNYYTISKIGDPSRTLSITYGDSTTSVADLGIVDGDTILCTTNQNGSKEFRQIQKLDIAAAKRNEIYDRDKLPTKYGENAVVDNANTGGLEPRRPWVIDWSRVMDGMVLWLDAGDTDSYPGTGTVWTDLTDPANSGTLVGTITYSSDAGGALVFPNPNTSTATSYVRMNRVTEFQPTAAITVEQWLYPDDWTPAAGQQSISCTEGGGYAISLRNNGIDFIVSAGGSYRVGELSDASGLSGWNHIVATFDGRYARMYVNGVLADIVTDVGSTVSITYNATNGLFIGAEAGGNATTPNTIQSYEGKIGTTAIYNRALTPTEILKNYNSDRSRFGV